MRTGRVRAVAQHRPRDDHFLSSTSCSSFRSRHHSGRVVALVRAAARRTLRALAPDTRAVVSTYPGASQVLGALRRRGRLTVPAFTYLTDFSVHTLWVAPGIDAHLAVHPVPA